MPQIDINLDDMRAQFFNKEAIAQTGTNLELLYKNMLGLPLVPTERWLFVDKKTPPKPVIIARSTRY